MAFGKRTDDVIGSVPNKPKLTKYIIMEDYNTSNISDDEKIVKQLEFKKDDLFNNFENDEDIHFLSFENEGFIPIEDDFDKIKKLFLDQTNEFSVKITNETHDSNDYIFTVLSNSELKNCLSNINSLNLYLTMGFFEFDRFKGPLFFIPLIIQGNIIKRDYNKDIKFNYFLKAELKSEYDISLPDFNLNVDGYLNELKKNSDFKISHKCFIGNFYFRNLLIYNDLDLSNWYNSYDKFKSFFKNDYIYSIEEFKNLNNDIAIKWPSLNLSYEKDIKMKGADKLIINLLSNGNSILYVSNYYSKNEVIKSLSSKHLNSLILDFNYNSDKYSFFKDVENDLISFDDKTDISRLAEINIFNKKMFNILKNHYSNLNLTPFEIQEKLDEFSEYNYNLNLNIDENLLNNINSINEEIKDISNNVNLINIITNNSEDFNFTNFEFKKFKTLQESINQDLMEFKAVNQDLNKKYGLLIFDNLVLPQYLESFNFLNEESKYLAKDDYDKINEFLKVYKNYKNLKDNGINIYSKKINKYVNDIVSQKTKLEKFNDKFDEVNSLVEYLDISSNSFEESIELLSLLFKHPKIVDNEVELKNIVKTIEEYQNENNFNGTSINQLKQYLDENDEINQFINEYKHYICNNSENLTLYKDIKNLSNLFHDSGFNFKTLNEYFNLNDKLPLFKNARYIENESYFKLNDYLKEFLKEYDDSLNNYLNNVFSQLRSIFNEVKSIIHNRYSVSYKEDLYNNITEILDIQKNLGFSFDNFDELVNYEDFIKYLNKNPNFDLNFANDPLVDNFEIINDFDISKTVENYIDLKINDFISLMQDIIDLAEEYLKDNYDWSYIKYNIQKIIEIKDKLGLNFYSLNDFIKNEDVLEILIQNPQLNYNVEDYELYLNIYKICQEYEVYDINQLLEILSKEHDNYFKSIKKELKPILNEEYDLKFIKDKINEIEVIINNLSELINCIKIDKFNEIDDFINNIKILKYKPTFIENYEEFDSYIETINFLENTNLLDEEFLIECNSMFSKFKDLPFESKLNELKKIIDLCYDNNTSILLLNTKKEFINLVDDLNNLNINYQIINKVDLDECIEGLKPNFSIIPDNQKNNDLKLTFENNNQYQNSIQNSILRKIDSSDSAPISKKYNLESKNVNLNKTNGNNYWIADNTNDVYAYLKNKNVSKEDVIHDLKLLKEYLEKFNELYDKLFEYINSNLNNIKEFSVKEEFYYNNIEGIMKISCPNSFKGLESNIVDLENEFKNNKSFTELVESGVFNETSYDYLSFEEINKQIDKLIKSKNELINLCRNSDFNLDDTFNNIISYITNLLADIEIFKEESSNDIFSLNYLKEYTNDDLLFKCADLNKDIKKLSNLNKQFINKYFKENYGLKVKENIKLVDKFNNLIKNKIVTDNTIKFLENTPQEEIENEINKLKIYINSINDNLTKKDFNLDDSLDLIVDKIACVNNDNLKFKKDIDEISYLLNLINFDNYEKYNVKLISFITQHNSKLNLNNHCGIFKQIISELDTLKEVCNVENYRNSLFYFSGDQINNELLKLKNNLIFNNLVKSGKITENIPKDTMGLILLIDETKKIINENDYFVNFDELIKSNENAMVELNKFNVEFDKISGEVSNNSLEFLSSISEIENLFNEYSIPLNENFIKINKEISQNLNLIILGSSLDLNLFELSKTELVNYTVNMDLNKEFTNLIDSKIFSKSVSHFYNENYDDKLNEMEILSSNIVNAVNKKDLDTPLLDIVNSDIEKLFDDYSEIVKLKEKDSNEFVVLINNYLIILDKISILNKNKIFITDYSSDISKIKKKFDNLIKLHDYEVEIQKNEVLIKKHFNEIINSDSYAIDQLYEKIESDVLFTKYYDDKIFSDKTINNSEFLKSIDLTFDDSILKLYDSNDYQDIYDKNKGLIIEIDTFENNIIKQKEFLINVNKLLKNDNLEKLLKLNIDSKLSEYESLLDDLSDLNQKYFSGTNDIINELISHISYTEIIENKLFVDEKLIKSNLNDIYEELNELNNIYYSLLKNIYKINEFYKTYPYFELNQNSFNYEISFETLENILNIFDNDLNSLNRISGITPIVISLIHQINEQNIDFSKMWGIFNYNLYNSILNKFYEDFPEVNGKNLDPNNYKKELDKIDKQINKNRFNQVLTEIYGNLHEKSDSELILTQKDLLNKQISNKTIGTIKETLNEFKEYILNVKPIFMMDINQFYEYISSDYESLFDYVILDKNFEFEELDTLSLFLRSKNKLIDLR